MPDQKGLSFLFEINDKVTANLAKIEAKAKSSAAKIDKAFTKASKSHEVNTARIVAIEQRRVAAAQSNSAKLAAIEQRRAAAAQSNSTKLIAIEQKREVAAQRTSERATALLKRESDARTRFATKAIANQQRSTAKTVAILKRESAARARSTAKAIAADERRVKAAKRAADMQIKATERIEKAKKKALEKSLARIKRESEAFKRSMIRLASAAAVAFAAVAAKAIQMAGGYDAAMRSVQAKTGATGDLMDRLSEQSREMGRTTVHSATEAARGQAFLAQAGFDANQILEALPATLALATAGELDLASAADIASNVLKGFRLETAETGRVTDVLAAIAAKTNTSVTQMGVALAKAAPAAASAGWSLEQTAAAIGRLSDAGIQGEEAGTVLKTMLARLAAPTGKLEKLMTATGISVKDTTGKMLPLNDIIAQLAPHADNTGLMFELLGTRGANAGLILGSLASDDLNNLTAELENSEGAAQTMADTMSGGLWGSIKSIQSIVESAYISLGERFGPAVGKIAKLFAKLPAPIQEVIVVVGSLAGAMGGLMLIMPQAFGAIVHLPGKLLLLSKSLTIANVKIVALTVVTKLVTAAQWLWNAALTANPIGLAVAAVALLAAGLLILYKRMQSIEQAEKDEATAYKAKLKRLKALAKAAAARRKADKAEAKEKAKAAKAAAKAAKLEEKRIKAMKKAEKATKKLKKQQDALRESFKDTINPSKKLGVKLKVLIDEFDRDDVVKAYWKEILKARDASVKFKTKLDPLIKSMVEQAEAQEDLDTGLQDLFDRTVNLNKVVIPLGDSYKAFNQTIGPEKGTAALLDEVNEHIDEEIGKLEELDEVVATSTAAEDFADQWNTAMGTLTANISQAITGVFTGEGSPLKKLGNAFKEFAKGAFSAIMTTLLTPVLNAMTNIAKKIGEKLFESITSSITSALADSLVGGTAGSSGAGGGAGVGASAGGMVGGLISGGIAAIGSIIGGFIARGRSHDIERNTKHILIDVHGIRHGLATGEFSLGDVRNLSSWFEIINAKLSETLYSIKYSLEKTIPQKMDSMHSETMTIQRSLLARADSALAAMGSMHSETMGVQRSLLTRSTSALVAMNSIRSNTKAGPEMFRRPNPGGSDPHGARGGGMDAKALGKAVADALEGTKVEVDGRKLGRLTVRHQPLAMAELGGRR